MHRCLRHAAILVGVLLLAGCGENANLFSDSFRNYVSGNVVPLTPGGPSGFVLVRLVNNTRDAIEFVVTAERQFQTQDAEGNPIITTEDETVRLRTFPVETASEVGALFDCPVTRIGLGEDINRPTSEPGLFILEDPDPNNLNLAQGFGVPSNVFPLDSLAGNFVCGDTVVYRVIESESGVANLKVEPFVLQWVDQPQEFTGSHTFNNARIFLEEQVREDE